MSQKKNSNKLPPFVPLIWDLLNSLAYKKLTYSAAKALPYFLGKVKVTLHDPEKYVMTFSFSYSEAKKYGFSTATFYRVWNELGEVGFIEIAEKGGLRGDSKSCNKYRLSRNWESYGKEPFKWPVKNSVKVDEEPIVKKRILLKRKIPAAL